MPNSPGQVPTPQPQPTAPVQPQNLPPVSDKTIDAFMAVPEEKKREALGKMSEPTKQALLQGIKTRKGISTSQPQPSPERPPSSTSNPIPQYLGSMAGFTPGHQGSALVQGGKNFLQGTTGASPLTPGPSGETRGEGSIIETLANIDQHAPEMGEQSNEIRGQSKEALKRFAKSKNPEDLVEGMTKSVLSLVPMLGPYLNEKYNQGMSGDIGGAITEAGATLATAKLLEHITDINKNTPGAIKDAFSKPAVIAASNKVLDDLKDTQVGKPGVKLAQDNSALGIAIKAKKNDIENSVNGLIAKDKIQNPSGATPTSLAINVIDQAIKDKDAVELSDGGELPKTNAVRKLIDNNYGPKLTFSNLKDIRSIIGGLQSEALGKDRAVLGDMYNSYTQHMTGLAKQIGGLDEWLDYNKETEKLNNHQNGIIKELKSHDTGVQYANMISKESNAGRLSDFESDIGLPKDFFKNTVKDFGPVRRYANLTEGGSEIGLKGGRLSAVLRHAPITLPGMILTAEVMKPFSTGIPYANYAAALYSAVKIDDFMNRFDAAKRIREIGGPNGVTGRYGAPGSISGARPSTGPGGGGTLPPSLPSGNTPLGSPPSGVGRPFTPAERQAIYDDFKSKISPAIAKLVKPSFVQEAENGLSEADKGIEEAKQRAEDARLGKTPKPGQGENAWDKPDTRPLVEQEAGKKETEERAKAVKATKVPEEARGREASARKGMTKDTPEARRAKAAAKRAADRASGKLATESSGGDVAGKAEKAGLGGKVSLEDQARMMKGKLDFTNLKDEQLEGALTTLYGEEGKKMTARFKALSRQKKWSGDFYRDRLEETITARIDELAAKAGLPDALKTEPKELVQEYPSKVVSKTESTSTKSGPKTEARRYRGGVIIKKGKQYTVRIAGKERGVVNNFADAQEIIDRFASGYGTESKN